MSSWLRNVEVDGFTRQAAHLRKLIQQLYGSVRQLRKVRVGAETFNLERAYNSVKRAAPTKTADEIAKAVIEQFKRAKHFEIDDELAGLLRRIINYYGANPGLMWPLIEDLGRVDSVQKISPVTLRHLEKLRGKIPEETFDKMLSYFRAGGSVPGHVGRRLRNVARRLGRVVRELNRTEL